MTPKIDRSLTKPTDYIEPAVRPKIGAPPRRDPRPGERFSIATRVTPELKRRLDAAAAESGRSQAQETELRLERSFDRTDLLTEVLVLAHGKEVAAALLHIGILMKASPDFQKQTEKWLKQWRNTLVRGRGR
jgi:hypothetical protein